MIGKLFLTNTKKYLQMKTKKLHLGASRLEKLSIETLQVMLNNDWVHLGELTLQNPNNRPLIDVDYNQTNFVPFYYKLDQFLPFKNDSFSFMYSEHFFEHFFLDEAIGLFKGCNRILEKNGVFRIVLPDADLRTVPEKLGFPNIDMPYSDPRKHKTRWSYYSLYPLLELSGFKVVPIKYFDKDGVQQEFNYANNQIEYEHCKDNELIINQNYIKRKNSLIVDAIK